MMIFLGKQLSFDLELRVFKKRQVSSHKREPVETAVSVSDVMVRAIEEGKAGAEVSHNGTRLE